MTTPPGLMARGVFLLVYLLVYQTFSAFLGVFKKMWIKNKNPANRLFKRFCRVLSGAVNAIRTHDLILTKEIGNGLNSGFEWRLLAYC